MKSTTDNRLIIPLKEAASQLSMCRQSLMKYVNQGALPCVRLAKNAVYFKPEDIAEFVEKHHMRYSLTSIPILSELQ